jgi:hypothetical protein
MTPLIEIILLIIDFLPLSSTAKCCLVIALIVAVMTVGRGKITKITTIFVFN